MNRKTYSIQYNLCFLPWLYCHKAALSHKNKHSYTQIHTYCAELFGHTHKDSPERGNWEHWQSVTPSRLQTISLLSERLADSTVIFKSTLFVVECHWHHFQISPAELVIGVLDICLPLLLKTAGMFATNPSLPNVKLKTSCLLEELIHLLSEARFCVILFLCSIFKSHT